MTIETEELIPVWIISRHPLVVRYLQQQLKKDSSILAQPLDDWTPLRVEFENRPLVILDSCGLETPPADYIRSLNGRFNDLRYVIIDHGFDIHVIYQLLALGAQGFLACDEVPEFLSLAIRSVHNGGTWVDATLLQKYVKLNRRTRESVDALEEEYLTMREEEILQLARQRLSNKEIAGLLGIEVSTVKFHLSNIFSKLNVAGRSDLWRNSIHRMAQQAASNSLPPKRPEGVSSFSCSAQPDERSC
jgi:DNA-binding NarL/FixJ family response regulator